MSALHGTTLTGTDTLLDRTAVTAFQARLRGELLSPDDPPYEQARKVWNGMINKYPALIARCTGVADVVEAVQFANVHDLPGPFAVAVTTLPAMPPVTAGWSSTSPR